jgi:hypothetical protein
MGTKKKAQLKTYRIRIGLEDIAYGRMCGMVRVESSIAWEVCQQIAIDAIEKAYAKQFGG